MNGHKWRQWPTYGDNVESIRLRGRPQQQQKPRQSLQHPHGHRIFRTRRMTCNDALIKLVGRSMGHQRAANQQVHADNTWLPLQRGGRSCQFGRFDATQLQFGDISPNQTLEHFCYKNSSRSYWIFRTVSWLKATLWLLKVFKLKVGPFHYATTVSLATEFVKRYSNNAPNEQITFRGFSKVLKTDNNSRNCRNSGWRSVPKLNRPTTYNESDYPYDFRLVDLR